MQRRLLLAKQGVPKGWMRCLTRHPSNELSGTVPATAPALAPGRRTVARLARLECSRVAGQCGGISDYFPAQSLSEASESWGKGAEHIGNLDENRTNYKEVEKKQERSPPNPEQLIPNERHLHSTCTSHGFSSGITNIPETDRQCKELRIILNINDIQVSTQHSHVIVKAQAWKPVYATGYRFDAFETGSSPR
jgi:hypothetical protein